MDCQILFKQDEHVWYAFGQDPAKPDNIIDTNQIVIKSGMDTVLLDPGGLEIFPNFLAALSEKVSIESIKHIFLSHQDPDIGSSLSLWRRICNEDVKIYLPWMWAGFVSHFDVYSSLISVPDEGMTIRLTNGRSLDMVPAHFLHSPGNLNMYDPFTEILFSGDIGAALMPSGERKSFFVDDFGHHIQYMEAFHKRWMGYREARDAWIGQTRRLDPKMIVPQHGLCFRDESVGAFLDWFGDLEIGLGVSVMQDPTALAEAPPDAPPQTEHEETVSEPVSPSTPAGPPPPDPQPGNADGTLVIQDDAPLFSRLGGDPAIDVVVDAFYSHVLSDPRVSKFFENTDTRALKKKQKQFMAKAFGGPDPYTGQDIRAAHARLVAGGLNDSHFDIVAEHLKSVMKEFQVPPNLIDEVMQIVGSTRGDILNKQDAPPPSDPPPSKQDDDSLFARIGGEPAIDAVVDAFYSRVLSDPRISSFFENVDPDYLKKMQRQFMAMAFGGPDSYSGQDMRSAHARLVADGLNDSHFDIVAEHLLGVLTDFQVEQSQIDEIMQIVGSTRDDVLSH